MGHTHRHQFGFKKNNNNNQVESPSPESRVPETGSDPPIGSGRDSGRDIQTPLKDDNSRDAWLNPPHLLREGPLG